MKTREITAIGLRALGRAIKEGRKDMKLSQATFAELCDLHPTYIGRIERGEKNISFENIYRVARALKLKPSWLLDRANL